MSKLLLEEHPLTVMPKLAAAIGLNEAVVLQQVHYWLMQFAETDKESHFIDGRWWVYNTPAGWREDNFPFWSESTIRRTFDRLRELGLVIVGQFNKRPYDRTLWYSIDYEQVKNLEASMCSERAHPSAHFEQMDNVKMSAPIPETTTETTTECSAHAENTQKPQAQKQGQTPEQELDAFFGSPRKRKMPPTTHWTERASQPWTGWSRGHFRERDGVSVDAQERVAWLVEKYTSLAPPSSSYTGWANGCIAVYQAARGDWAAIEDGIKEAAGRQRDFVPRTLACTVKNADQNGFVKAALSAWAERQRPPAPQAVAVNVYT